MGRMKLKTRLFILVAVVFIAMQVLSIVWTYGSVTRQVSDVREKIEQEFIKYSADDIGDYISFLSLAITKEQLRINTLFDNIGEYSWLKERYAPSIYNFETNQWANSATLLSSNLWLDFMQTTVRDKLTSCMMMRPPFLHNSYIIPLAEGLNLIVEVHENNDLEVYIGVPFWSNEVGENFQLGQHDLFFSIETARDNWLLFTPEQLLDIKPDEFHARNFSPPSGPFVSTMNIQSKKVYKNLIDSTIKDVLKVRGYLMEKPEYLQKAKNTSWIKSMLDQQIHGGEDELFARIESCESYMCNYLKTKEKNGPSGLVHDWQERDDQNRLIWELSTITSTGIWFFDPFSRVAPKGVASFPNSETAKKWQVSTKVGFSMHTKDVFHDAIVPVGINCKPPAEKGEINTCLTSEFNIIQPLEDSSVIFMTKTLTYAEMDPNGSVPHYGTLSLGVNIANTLELLALICPDSILYLPEQGEPVMFDTHGIMIPLTSDEKRILRKLCGKNQGIVTDTDGKEYYYYHVIDLIEGDAHVFIIQYRDQLYNQITNIEQQGKHFLIVVTQQMVLLGIVLLAVVLLIFNYFIRRILKPIANLVENTEVVAMGDLEKVHVSEKDKQRKDEMGVLVSSFEHMVEKMKEGNQVRALLHKVVNKEVAEKILSQGVVLGGEVRTVAVLFSDIRHFTHISENMQPQDVLAMLNDCLNVLSAVVDEHKGVIDKYVGDEIMAFFGAPLDMENPPLQAVLCAIAMMRVLREWNRHRESIGYRQLTIGIGIHVGEVIAGNMGAENHLNYTVLGHNVNLAHRFCEHAGEMEILISQEVLNYPNVRARIEVEELPPANFFGISHPVPVFRVKY